MLNQSTAGISYNGNVHSQLYFLQWTYNQYTKLINYFVARKLTHKESMALWEKLHSVNNIIREIECLKDKKVNSVDLFAMNIVSLMKSSHAVFDQIRTILKCKSVTSSTLDQIDRSLKTIADKLHELKSKDEAIEAGLKTLRDGECLVIHREYAGMGLTFFREPLNSASLNCHPHQEPICNPCTISYDTIRAFNHKMGDEDPVFLPAHAKRDYQLKC